MIKKILGNYNILSIRKLGSCLCFFYCFLLFYIVFLARRRRTRVIPEANRINLIPGDNAWYFFIQNIHTAKDNYYFYTDLIGNIILFIPFPFSLLFIFGVRDYRKAILITCSTSIAIEGLQYILNIGVADINDLLLNTFGGIIGVMILKQLKIRNLQS